MTSFNARIFEGDFKDVKLAARLADNSIDLIFTDPPYDEKSLYLYADLAKMVCSGSKNRRQSCHIHRTVCTTSNIKSGFVRTVTTVL